MDAPSAWFLADAAKHRVEVLELSSQHSQRNMMSEYEVNSLDVCNNILVCASDNTALGLYYNLTL